MSLSLRHRTTSPLHLPPRHPYPSYRAPPLSSPTHGGPTDDRRAAWSSTTGSFPTMVHNGGEHRRAALGSSVWWWRAHGGCFSVAVRSGSPSSLVLMAPSSLALVCPSSMVASRGAPSTRGSSIRYRPYGSRSSRAVPLGGGSSMGTLPHDGSSAGLSSSCGSRMVCLVRSKWLEGVNSLFKILQAQLNYCVSKTNGEAILALAQLSYASHLHKSSTRLNTKPNQQGKKTPNSTP